MSGTRSNSPCSTRSAWTSRTCRIVAYNRHSGGLRTRTGSRHGSRGHRRHLASVANVPIYPGRLVYQQVMCHGRTMSRRIVRGAPYSYYTLGPKILSRDPVSYDPQALVTVLYDPQVAKDPCESRDSSLCEPLEGSHLILVCSIISHE